MSLEMPLAAVEEEDPRGNLSEEPEVGGSMGEVEPD